MVEKEIYYLNKGVLPTIPVPHDCVIQEIKLENNCVVFIFEEDICYHDSIRYRRPTAKSLVIRFHLENDLYDVRLFERRRKGIFIRIFHKTDVYKEINLVQDFNRLSRLCENGLEYLYHYVGDCEIIIRLISLKSILLDMRIDRVEFEWIDA